MEFPGLLAVLLYQDCAAYIPAAEERLKTLAEANGKISSQGKPKR
jgi:hypothetical protein